MAAQVSRLQVIVDAETAGAESGLRRVASAIQGLVGLGGKVGGALAAPFQGLADVLGKIGLASMGVQALVGSVQGLGQTLLGTNIEFENTKAALAAFTGSGEEAAKLLAVIRDEAAKTPFAFKDMAQAVTMLVPAAKAAGMDIMELVKRAELLAALNPAEGLTGAAFALREALSGDFVSLVERFNLPRQYINQLKEEGVPAIEIVDRVLKQMGVSTDLVSNLAQTASGRWSTFVDTLEMLKATAMEAFFQKLSGAFGGFVEWLSANQPRLEAFAAAFGEKLAGAFERLLGSVQSAIPAIRAAVGEFLAGFQGAQVDSFIGRIGAALGSFVGFLTGTVVPAVAQAMTQFWAGFKSGEGEGFFARLGAAAAGFLGWLTGTFIPQVTTAIEQFKAGLRGESDGSFFGNLGQGVANLSAMIQQALPALQSVGNFITGTLIPAIERLGGAAQGPLGQFVGAISANLPTIIPMLGAAAAAFAGLQMAVNALGTAVGPVMMLVSTLRMIGGVGPMISMVVGLLGGPLTIAIAGIAAAVGVAAVAWTQNWGNIQQHTQTAIQGIAGTLSTIGSTIQSALSSVAQAAQPVVSAIGGLAQQLFQDWAQWLNQIAPTAQQAFQNVVSFVSTIGGAIMSALSAVASAIMAFVNANREGLVQIIQGAWQVISSLITGVSEMIQGVLTVIISLLAGDWRQAWEGAKQVVQAFSTMVQGILQGALNIILGILRVLVNTAYQILSEGWERARLAVAIAWDAIKEKIGEVKDRVIEIVREMVEKVVQKAQELVDKFREIGSNIIEAIVGAIRSGISKVIGVVSDLAQSAIDAAKGVLGIKSPSRVFGEIGSDMVEGLTGALESGKPSVEQAIRAVVTPPQSLLSESRLRFTQLGEVAVQGIVWGFNQEGEYVIQDISDRIRRGREMLADVFEPAIMSGRWPTPDSFGQPAEATTPQPQNPFGPQFLEQARAGLEQARALIQELSPQVFAALKEQFSGVTTEAAQLGPNMGTALTQGLIAAQEQIAATASQFREQALAPLDVSAMAQNLMATLITLSQQLPPLIEPIRNALSALDIRDRAQQMVASLQSLAMAVISTLTQVNSAIKSFDIRAALNNVLNALNEFGILVSTGFLEALRKALRSIQQGWQEIIKDTQRSLEILVGAVQRAADAIVRIIRDMVRTVRELIGQMNNDLTQIGYALVQGVVDALRDAQGEMVEAIVKVLKQGITVAKAMLGISSPSRVFYEIGEQMMAGLALGVENGAERAIRSLAAAVDRMSDVLDGWNPEVQVAVTGQPGETRRGLPAEWFMPY